MLILSSPAKRLDFDSPYQSKQVTQPLFLKEAAELIGLLRKQKTKKIAKTLEVSDALAELNYKRFQDWKAEHSKPGSRPAIIAYHGDVHQQIEHESFELAQQEYAQKSLRFITGLYGILRPYDMMQPYRLEMKIKLKTKGKKNLYEFWKENLTNLLQQEIKSDNHSAIINLASLEYSKAIDLKKLSVPTYTVKFQQYKNGKYKSIMLPVKQARGIMINYLIKNRVERLEELKSFDVGGYSLASSNDSELIFTKQ